MVGSTTMCPRGPFSTGKPAMIGLGTAPAARTIVSASNRFVREVNLAGFDRPHPSVGSQFNSGPLCEHSDAIRSQRRIDFRHDPIAGLEQDEADLAAIHIPIEMPDTIDERGQLAEQLHPDQSAADDYKGEKLRFPLQIGLHVGPLEPLDDVVAEQQGVGESFECEGVLRTGNHLPVGLRPQGQDQLVVCNSVAFALGPPGGPRAGPGRCSETVASTKRRRAQKGADWQRAIPHIECSRKNLEQAAAS